MTRTRRLKIILEKKNKSETHSEFKTYYTAIVVKILGEGNGNPLQRSCLENPRDSVAWWAAVYGVAQSRTRLKRLSSSSSSRLQSAVFK